MKKKTKLKKLLYSPQYLIALILFACAIFFYFGAEKQREENAKEKQNKIEEKINEESAP